MKLYIFILIYGITFSSCVPKRIVETDLYFGLSKPDGSIINDVTWDNFIKEYVAKVYTKGFTQIKSEGKWLDTNTNKLIQEPSRIIISVQKLTKSLSSKIDSIRMSYKKIFDQQAVLRVDKKVQKITF